MGLIADKRTSRFERIILLYQSHLLSTGLRLSFCLTILDNCPGVLCALLQAHNNQI